MPNLVFKETTGNLPTSEYKLFDDKTPVGKIQIRHKVSRGAGIPDNMASHVYYEIYPEHRSKGYGKKILALGIEKAREEIGLKEIYITCMKDNEASKKIIESNGGIFIEESIVPKGIMLKYKI